MVDAEDDVEGRPAGDDAVRLPVGGDVLQPLNKNGVTGHSREIM
jgi:hypothetical protein